MICQSEARAPTAYPELSQYKAARMRHLVRALVHLLRRADLTTEASQHRLRCLEHMQTFYEVVHSSDIVLSGDQANRVLRAVHSSILHYSWLANFYARQGVLLYLMVPKFHFWFHAAQMARWCNPKFASTYSSEDFVGRVAAVAASVIKGRTPTKVAAAVARNYRAAIEVRSHRRLA
jgi:hypothetical protein